MAILNIQSNEVGQAGVTPRIVRIETDDDVSTVTASGYLTDAVKKGRISLDESDICLVVTQSSANAAKEVGWFEVSKSGTNWSLVPPNSPGEVELPTVANRIAHFTNTTGTLSDDAADVVNDGDMTLGSDGTEGLLTLHPASASSGTLVLKAVDSSADVAVTISNADHGQASVYSIPDGGQSTANFIISENSGTQSIASGNLQVDTGDITAGSDANAGKFVSHPASTNSGTLELTAVDSSADSAVTISNADFGQSTTLSIPDPGAATANFLLDDGAANILSWQQFVGLESILAFSAGTWTTTRIARGDYVSRHTVADDTTIIGIDITPMIRTASSKGFRLDSFDVIYSIAADALDAHSATLDRVEYADNVAVSVNSITISGSLATATQTNPYVTNLSVDSPAFDNTADSKYVIEVTVDNSASSEYDFYGIMLRFSETVA